MIVQAQRYLHLINQLGYTYSYQHADIFDISDVVWSFTSVKLHVYNSVSSVFLYLYECSSISLL